VRKLAELAVVRVRGSVGTRKDVEDTLRTLGLTRVNHCVVIEDSPSHKGMLQKVKDMATWGEVGPEALEVLLRKRGRLTGDERLSDEFVKSHTKFESIKAFSGAVCGGEASLAHLPGLKKVFRLRPPKKGYGKIKQSFRDGGALGYRGEEINGLIMHMS